LPFKALGMEVRETSPISEQCIFGWFCAVSEGLLTTC
jgi:hypothetical protein